VRLAIHTLGDIANALLPGVNGTTRLWATVAARDASTSAKRRRGSIAGGNTRASQADTGWRNDAREQARRLLNTGTLKRDIAGILAPRFGKDPKTIRTAIAVALKETDEA
jgi:hypothetical protein